MRSSLAPARRTAALVVVFALALAGCGGKDDEPAKASPGESPSTSEAAEPTPTPTEADPTPVEPEPSETPTGFATLTDRLLPTAAVPGLNAQWKWQDGETVTAGPAPFGVCAKASLLDIGATEVIHRSYFPPADTDDNAAQQIAEFPDAATATRAAAVLRSWHAKCKVGKGNKLGKLVPVTTADGTTGYWYLATRGETATEEGRFQAFGVVVTETRISVLQISNGGQDYNYTVGKEPMVGMVRAAADRLG